MKLNITKGKMVLLILIILVSIGISGFMTYQILNLTNEGQEITEFKAELAQITEVTPQKVTLDEDLKELEVGGSDSILFIYDNYDNSNPFKSLLKKKPKPKPEPKPKEKTKQEIKSNQKEATAEDKEPQRPEVEFLGTVDSKFNKRAIIKLEDSGSYIVREGEMLNGLKIKKITVRRITIEKEGKEFIYDCGGDFCQNGKI